MFKTALIAALLAVSSSAFGCGSTSAAPAEATSPFTGTWTYQPGSTIVADCAGAPEQTLDLSKVPPANQPGYFTFSATGADALHEVDARGCQYDWTVSGAAASAAAGQSCATFPDGRGGNRVVHLQSGTKTTNDGAQMSVDVRFTTDPPSSCTIHVQGIATK
jgi:hypothetical protein